MKEGGKWREGRRDEKRRDVRGRMTGIQRGMKKKERQGGKKVGRKTQEREERGVGIEREEKQK